MVNFCRKLETNLDAEYFVDGVLCIEDDDEKEAAINRITAAERNIKDYSYYSTLDHIENRHYKFRDETSRQKLRKNIVKELFDMERLPNDDDICFGAGGAKPCSNTITTGKAFYVIGPPASGKSGVANQLADMYGCYLLDSDYAKRKLPEYSSQIGAASLVHDESDDIIFGENGLMDQCLQKSYSVVIPKIGHNLNSVCEFCKGLKDAGYTVYLVSVELDRQKAVQRAYYRYTYTNRYVPLSLIFDGYGNQPTLNYFKIKQQHSDVFSGFAQISTDVPFSSAPQVIENINIEALDAIVWR